MKNRKHLLFVSLSFFFICIFVFYKDNIGTNITRTFNNIYIKTYASEAISFNYGFIKTHNHLYKDGLIISSSGKGPIDIETFNIVPAGKGLYVMDKNNIFMIEKETNKITSDTGNFQVNIQDDSFATDSRSIYYYGKILSGLNSTGFKVLQESYIQNSDGIYTVTSEGLITYKNIDTGSAVIISERYIKDKNNVYDPSGEILSGVDAKSTVYINNSLIKDKNGVYDSFATSSEDKILYIDQNTLISVEGIRYLDVNNKPTMQYSYSKDKNHVYFGSDIIKGADPKTFEYYKYDGDCDRGKDKNSYYQCGEKAQLKDFKIYKHDC